MLYGSWAVRVIPLAAIPAVAVAGAVTRKWLTVAGDTVKLAEVPEIGLWVAVSAVV